MATLAASRAWRGPALFSCGFRPFFLGGAVWGALVIGLWAFWVSGAIVLPSAMPPVAWHVHELMFGMIAAVIAGFLLTAIPNWTGRPPIAGWSLVGLVALWGAGRLAVALSALAGLAPALGVALLFPLATVIVAAREIVAAGNARNLTVVGVVAVFAAGQAVFAAELLTAGYAVLGPRIAIGAALMLVMLIGGRIIASFTANWLKAQGQTRLPRPFGRFDKLALVLGAFAVAVWVAQPALGVRWTGMVLLVAAGAHGLRLARWRPLATWRAPLLAVLHLAYVFVPAGFALAGYGIATDTPLVAHAAVHAWTIGALGLMILAVMTRASRGHTGRPLTAPPATVALYGVLAAAAIARAAASLHPAAMAPLLWLSAGLWVAAFAGFALLYGPMLVLRRAEP
ncbi:MAG: NnrS family protein [Acuticoccus sp.]